MMMLRSYEPGIVDIIFKCIKSHTFKTKKELQEAVNLWCVNREECIKKYGHISNWDVSQITNMCELFENKTHFNDDISGWDLSSVTNMCMMFYNATNFNKPIGDWDVSNVTNMYGMFKYAQEYNQLIGDWDVSNVKNMHSMFFEARKFNQPIGDWDVSSVTDMSCMFEKTIAFNQPIGDWDVSSVTHIYCMFEYATNFNQHLSKWNLVNNEIIYDMFYKARNFDYNNINENMKSKMKSTSYNSLNYIKEKIKIKLNTFNNINFEVYPSCGHIRNMNPECMSIDIDEPNYISIQSFIQKDYYYSWDFSNINNSPKRINNKLKYQRDRNTRYQNKL